MRRIRLKDVKKRMLILLESYKKEGKQEETPFEEDEEKKTQFPMLSAGHISPPLTPDQGYISTGTVF